MLRSAAFFWDPTGPSHYNSPLTCSSLQGTVPMMQLTICRPRTGWLLLVAAWTLSACVSLPPVGQPAAPQARNAAELGRRGEHDRAASAYEALAAQAGSASERSALQLSAAREWLAASRPDEAARVIAAISAAPGSQDAYQVGLLRAQTTLALHRPQQAWQQISALTPAAGGPAALQYYSLRMDIAIAADLPVEGIRAELSSERYTSADAQRLQLRSQLLAALLRARARGVNLAPGTERDPIVRGWLELGATAEPSRAVSLNSAALAARWRARYPNHPATAILAQAFPAPLGNAAPGSRLALLLPLTGPYAADGATVRDGFLSALYQVPAASRPSLHLYDTGAQPAVQVVQQARTDGTSFIVGPLVPDAVSAVAALGAEPVPLLALNALPDGQMGPAGLYQFALSPDDEARMAAQRILADGHRHGIIIVPRNDWGTRVAGAFERELTLGGGSVIGEASYDPTGHDYGVELSGLLRIDDSQERHTRLERALGTKLNFVPRHRGDIEFVFIVPYSALNARLIQSQLNFNFAFDIPTYSISRAYEPDSHDANQDLFGLMYPDMPWMIDGQSAIADLRSTIGHAWGNRVDWHSQLFAFGYDACQLMLAMSAPYANPAAVQIDGLTGQLHFDAGRRVQRDLVWVRIARDGEPHLLGASPQGPGAPAAATPQPQTPAAAAGGAL
jgi:uncharacterized protein